MAKTPVTKKKRTKKRTSKHATQSFSELVSDVQLEKLKPYVVSIVNRACLVLEREITKNVFAHIARLTVKISALEELAKTKWEMTDEALITEQAKIEEKLMGFELSAPEAEAKEGDRIQATVAYTGAKDEELVKRLFLEPLCGEGAGDLKPIHDAIVGHKRGDVIDLKVKKPGEKEEVANYIIKVDRISTKIAAAEEVVSG